MAPDVSAVICTTNCQDVSVLILIRQANAADCCIRGSHIECIRLKDGKYIIIEYFKYAKLFIILVVIRQLITAKFSSYLMGTTIGAKGIDSIM